jgi:hypothetical protein
VARQKIYSLRSYIFWVQGILLIANCLNLSSFVGATTNILGPGYLLSKAPSFFPFKTNFYIRTNQCHTLFPQSLGVEKEDGLCIF